MFPTVAWNSNFSSYEFGPRVRLTSIVTAAPLTADPLYSGPPLCDLCMECKEHCPSLALSKETEGLAKVKIEDRVYKYLKKNKWRCGVSSVERLNELARSLEKAVPREGYFTAMDKGPMHGKADVHFDEEPSGPRRPDSYLDEPRSC